jgi:hypothetical protein
MNSITVINIRKGTRNVIVGRLTGGHRNDVT